MNVPTVENPSNHSASGAALMNESHTKLRLAVLVSGSGTNLQALIDRSRSGALAAEIVLVVSDRAGAYGLVRAENAGIPVHVVDYGEFLKDASAGSGSGDSPQFDDELRDLDRRQKILNLPDGEKRLERLSGLVRAERVLCEILDRYRPDYVCLAGWMRLVSPYFIGRYNRPGDRRVINIHPALLPSFPGRHGYRDTFRYGCKWGGITIHFVDEGEDTGPIIAQSVYPVWPDDSIESVRERGLRLEYLMYAQVINWLAAGQVDCVSDSEGRTRTRITDPCYRRVLKSWIKAAFDDRCEGE